MKIKNLKKYKAKPGIVIPIVYFIFVLAGIFIWAIPSKNNELIFKIVPTCILIVILILFTWAVFSTYYVLTDKCLICFSGPLKIRVLYQDITDITEGISLLSSFSLSAKRIFINRGRNILRRVDVSPKEKEEFLEELTLKIQKSKELYIKKWKS